MEIFTNWISDGTGSPFYVRKRFSVKKKIQKAEACVSGLGQFNFYVNGKRVSDHRLDPAWTDYRKTVNYVVFDVTKLLDAGENVMAAEVGNGWYLMDETGYSFSFPDFMPKSPNPYVPFGKELVFAAALEVLYEDGEKEVFYADKDALTAPHPVLHANVFGTEVMDGSLKKAHWNDIFCDEEEGWTPALVLEKNAAPAGKLTEQRFFIEVKETVPAKLVGKAGKRLIYDLGYNMAGMLKAEVRGKKGEQVIFRPAEKLSGDGDVDQMAKGWKLIDVYEAYTFGQDDVFEDYQMVFTYFGGRYIAVEGVEEEDIRNLTAEAITSAGTDDGSFETDDMRFNQIYDLVKKAVEANMMSVHTDCPTIERFAWQEENVMMAPSVMYMKHVDLQWRKFLQDARDAQHKATDFFLDYEKNKVFPGYGLIPSQAPCYIPNPLPVPGMGSFYDIVPWGSSIIIGLYWHYMFYGDKTVIMENYEAAKRYLSHLESRMDSNGFLTHGLGDWGNPRGEYARENIETAFFYWDYQIMTFLAHETGRTIDELRHQARAESIREHYNRILLVKDPATGLYGYTTHDVLVPGEENFHTTQAALALPLYLGMVPEDKRQDVLTLFRKKMEEDGAIVAGEVSQAYIIQTMADNGMNDLVAEFILKEEHPSYYAFVLDGETTLGEYWETNPRSHCHDMMGHIVEWFYNGIGGIRPLRPGFKQVELRPYLPKSMNHAKVFYKTIYGPITVEMTRKETEVELQVQLPAEVEYKVNDEYLK
ncbi:MAG: family 78 glycoside hydrolase catalytic domain [Lachnospiraceae bacterium]|nr:family 78 glycoside hydrolase catalytic domain [Lachnospiraceae bacterium]